MSFFNWEQNGLTIFVFAYTFQFIFFIITEVILNIDIEKQRYQYYSLAFGTYYQCLVQLLYAYLIGHRRSVPSLAGFGIMSVVVCITQTLRLLTIIQFPAYRNNMPINPHVEDLMYTFIGILCLLTIFYLYISPHLYKLFRKEYYLSERVNEDNRVKFDLRIQFQVLAFVWVANSINVFVGCFLFTDSAYKYQREVAKLTKDAELEDFFNGLYLTWSIISYTWIGVSTLSMILCYVYGVRWDKEKWIYQFLIIMNFVLAFQIVETIVLSDAYFEHSGYYHIYALIMQSCVLLFSIVIAILVNRQAYLFILKKDEEVKERQSSLNSSIRFSDPGNLNRVSDIE